jgi:predicted ABC-type ATPase
MADLVVIRGNSGSGKSTVARALRESWGRGTALVDQDTLRRQILREHLDVVEPIAPGLIDVTARYALNHGYRAIVEGILDRHGYGEMLTSLLAEHGGRAFYLDVSWTETVRRHAMRPQADQFTVEQMREWYRERDLLGVPDEVVISAESSVQQSVAAIKRPR